MRLSSAAPGSQLQLGRSYSLTRADRRLRMTEMVGRWWVGVVGVENNDVRNFKDLRGKRRSAKPLKNNMRERKVILIAPLKLPRVSVPRFLQFDFS